MLFGFAMPGIQEMLIIAIVIFFLFGARKIPEFAKGCAQAVKEIRKGKAECEAIGKEIEADIT